MLEGLFRELERLERQTSVPVSLPPDRDGYFDRECPAPRCEFVFKVHGDDWRNIVRDEEVFCPRCRATKPATHWHTKEQAKSITEQAMSEVAGRLRAALLDDAAKLNRPRRSNDFVSIRLEVSGRPIRVPLPRKALDPMRVRITCDQCACRYAVIGSAFFCPACGHSAAEGVFAQSIGVIRETLGRLAGIKKAIPDADQAENTGRLIVEGSLPTAVMAFQRFAEAIYERASGLGSPRRNLFQSLDAGSDLWEEAFGVAYGKHLAPRELQRLRVAFQQRHLLAHREGIVDEEYLRRSGDGSYAEGQRIVVHAPHVLDAIDLIEKLAAGLAADAQRKVGETSSQ